MHRMARKLFKQTGMSARTVQSRRVLSEIIAFLLVIFAISCYSVRVYSAGDDQMNGGGVEVTPPKVEIGAEEPEDSV